jgi:hypothetical protein
MIHRSKICVQTKKDVRRVRAGGEIKAAKKSQQRIATATTTSNNKRINIPPTRRGTFLAKSAAAKFARQQSAATPTNGFLTIIALVHFVTLFAIKYVTVATHADLVIALKFMAPMTTRADEIGTFVAADLHVVIAATGPVAVQTPLGLRQWLGRRRRRLRLLGHYVGPYFTMIMMMI